MKHPINQLVDLARRIQVLLGEYHDEEFRSLDFNIPWNERTQISMKASNNFMTKAGTQVLPEVMKILAEVEALLDTEQRAIAERVRPILSETQQWARHPTNPLGYAELSSSLSRLAGHLSVRVAARPTIFVGYRFVPEDEKLVSKFMELFRHEGFNCINGETARAEDIDDKAKEMIEQQSEGVIIIFTKEEELREGGWTTSVWLTDEKAFAIGKNKPVLLFFEDLIAQTQRKGIHGELEYIEFNRGNLDEALLKAIPYLRDFRQRVLERGVKHNIQDKNSSPNNG